MGQASWRYSGYITPLGLRLERHQRHDNASGSLDCVGGSSDCVAGRNSGPKRLHGFKGPILMPLSVFTTAESKYRTTNRLCLCPRLSTISGAPRIIDQLIWD